VIQPITLLGAALSLSMLYLRYKTRRKGRARSNPRRTIRLAHAIFIALLAWLTASASLSRLNSSFDGANPPPTLAERIVAFFSK